MAFVSDHLSYPMDLLNHPDELLDFDSFVEFPSGLDEQSASTDSISPAALSMPYEADASLNQSPVEFMQPSLPEMPSYGFSQEDFLANPSTDAGWFQNTDPLFDDGTYSEHVHSYDSASAFRQLVEMQAAADPRMASSKEKRREASIALHLQRLCDATAIELEMSSDSSTSFSSPSWSDFMRDSASPQPTKASPETSPTPASAPGVGGVELVLDLNMNATNNLPKKQKPRSQAQKENYIKARKYGACEKHKKQHKRCNCLEKTAARAGVSESPVDTAFKERPRPALQVSVSPMVRHAASTGHDPSSSSSLVLPSTKVTRSCDPSTALSHTRTKTRVPCSSPGHDPSFCPPLLVQPGKTTKSSAASHNGNKPTSSSLAVSRSTKITQDTTGNVHRAVGLQNTSVLVRPPDNSCAIQSSSMASRPVAGTRGSPRLVVRRLKQSTILADQPSLASTVTVNQAIQRRVTGSLGLQTGVNRAGILPVSENICSQTVSSSSKQLLASTQPRSQVLTRDQLPGISWYGGSVVHLHLDVRSLLRSTVPPFARALQSLRLSALWTDTMAHKCLSLSGRLLMTARKSLHLSHWRAF